MAKIHSMAVVDPNAEIAEGVEIGPFCIVGPDVKIAKGTKLLGQCNVVGYTTIGENNTIYPGASIGTPAEDYDVCGGKTYLRIGNDNIFREGVTVNTGTKPDSETVIGNGCFLMANSHVAHNCVLGDKVIMVVGAGLSGYVTVQENCIISGLSGIHQFCRMGRLSMLSGGSVVSMDIPPFVIAEGRNGAVKNLNLIGMKRNGFTVDKLRVMKNLFKIFFRSGLNVSQAIEKIRSELELIPEVMEFIEFVESSKRGVLHGRDTGRRQ